LINSLTHSYNYVYVQAYLYRPTLLWGYWV